MDFTLSGARRYRLYFIRGEFPIEHHARQYSKRTSVWETYLRFTALEAFNSVFALMFRVKVFRLNLGALGIGVKVGTWPLCSTNQVKRIIWGIFSVVLFKFFFLYFLYFFCWIHVFRENLWISLTSGLTTIMQIKICQSIN